MNVDDVRALVQAMEARPSRLPLLMPGTVAAVSGTVAEVTVDGDPDGSAVEAVLLTADVGPGDRVSLLFDPPRGVSVVGVTARRSEAGMVLWSDREDVPSFVFLANADTTFTSTLRPLITLEASRSYRVDYHAEIQGWSGDPNYVEWRAGVYADDAPIDGTDPFTTTPTLTIGRVRVPHNAAGAFLQGFTVFTVPETVAAEFNMFVIGYAHNHNHDAVMMIRWTLTDVGPTLTSAGGYALTR